MIGRRDLEANGSAPFGAEHRREGGVQVTNLCGVAGPRAYGKRRAEWVRQATPAHLLKEPHDGATSVGESTPPPFTPTGFPPYLKVSTEMACGAYLLSRADQCGFSIRCRPWPETYGRVHAEDRVAVRAPQSTKCQRLERSDVGWGRGMVCARERKMAQGISHEYCRVIQRNEGWQYDQKRVSA